MITLLKAAAGKPRKLRTSASVLRSVRNNLVQDLQELEHRSYGCGLYVTAHALNRAKNAAGWETAGDVEQAGKASRDERK